MTQKINKSSSSYRVYSMIKNINKNEIFIEKIQFCFYVKHSDSIIINMLQPYLFAYSKTK
jgi:hypothetical protein